MNADRLTPHGPGFSFIDEVSYEKDTSVLIGRKWLDPAWPIFADHFPGQPIFPAVLLAEASAQAAGALWGRLRGKEKTEIYLLAEIGKFRVKRPVLPGQTLGITVRLEREFGALGTFSAEITVEDVEVAAGTVTLALAPSPN